MNLFRAIAVCLTALVAFAVLAGCSGSDAPKESDVLVSLTDLVIVPRYEAAAAETEALNAALRDLCAAPSEAGVGVAAQAWRDARREWSRSEASAFGPAMDRRSFGLVDWSPVEPERIENTLAGGSPVTAEVVRDQMSSAQRGLGAIEYFLFGEAELTSDRCAYLIALGQVVDDEAKGILSDWTSDRDDSPPYGDFFTGRSSSSLFASQAVAEVIRTQVFLARTLADMRLATALGLREDESPDPSAIPGGAGWNSLDDLRNHVLGMRDIYVGADAEDALGVSDLIAPLSEDADERMRSEFDAVLSALDSVEGPLRQAVTERPDQVRDVYEKLQDLRRTLNTEVVSLLGVSVGFSDTDGDSVR